MSNIIGCEVTNFFWECRKNLGNKNSLHRKLSKIWHFCQNSPRKNKSSDKI